MIGGGWQEATKQAEALRKQAEEDQNAEFERQKRLARDREMMAPDPSTGWGPGSGPHGGRPEAEQPHADPLAEVEAAGRLAAKPSPDERGKAVGRIADWCAELHAQRVYSAHMDASLAGGRFEPAPEPDFRARAERLLDEEIYRTAADAVEARLRKQLEGMR